MKCKNAKSESDVEANGVQKVSEAKEWTVLTWAEEHMCQELKVGALFLNDELLGVIFLLKCLFDFAFIS